MYRLLNEGEPINEGDEAYSRDLEWIKVNPDVIGEPQKREWCPVRRDMSKWTKDIPPIGTKVEYEKELWIVIETMFTPHNKKMAITICATDGNDHVVNELVSINEIKPWEE